MSSTDFSKKVIIPAGKTLLLFDGYCNLCNGAVQFILKRDKKKQFFFAGLSWPAGVEIIRRFPKFKDADSILVFENGKVFDQSSAALKVAGRLGGLWPLMGIFWIVPRFLRDAVYSFIARNRYKWFGKSESCMIPDSDVKGRFLRSN